MVLPVDRPRRLFLSGLSSIRSVPIGDHGCSPTTPMTKGKIERWQIPAGRSTNMILQSTLVSRVITRKVLTIA